MAKAWEFFGYIALFVSGALSVLFAQRVHDSFEAHGQQHTRIHLSHLGENVVAKGTFPPVTAPVGEVAGGDGAAPELMARDLVCPGTQALQHPSHPALTAGAVPVLVYSGPGFNFNVTAFRTLPHVPLVPPPPRSLRAGAPNGVGGRVEEGAMVEVHLGDFQMDPGSPRGAAAGTNLRYLLMLDPDRLLWAFRATARIPTISQPYSGWEDPGCELRGHFMGHYLSSAAAAWAAHGGALRGASSSPHHLLLGNLTYTVEQLERCQDAAGEIFGPGYLSAFPSEFLDRYEQHKVVWAPYYTLHKIVAGLLDVHVRAASEASRVSAAAGSTSGGGGARVEAAPLVELAARALGVAVKLADYVHGRVTQLVERRSEGWHTESLHMEYGGMNDVLYRLASLTGDHKYLELGHRFEKPCFQGPLVGDGAGLPDHDGLSDMHGNTHIPLVVGMAQRYELTGEAEMRRLVSTFFHRINSTRTYATGGSTHAEIWPHPHHLGHTLEEGLPDQWGGAHQESCTSYNMLKLSRRLFLWTGEARYMEFYERAVLNGVLGTQRGRTPGVMLYNTPLGAGVSKAAPQHWRESGWGTPTASFWCCYGTLIESFAAIQDGVLYKRAVPGGGFELIIAQLAAGVATWSEAGMRVAIRASEPGQGSPLTAVTVTIALEWADLAPPSDAAAPPASLRIRVPAWASTSAVGGGGRGSGALGASARATWRRGGGDGGGESSAGEIPVPPEGGFVHVSPPGGLRPGDSVRFDLPAALRAEPLRDPRFEYGHLHALVWGPLVLAGLTEKTRKLLLASGQGVAPGAGPGGVGEWVVPVPTTASRQIVGLMSAGATGGPALLRHDTTGGVWVESAADLKAAAPDFGSGARRGGTDGLVAATLRRVPPRCAFEEQSRCPLPAAVEGRDLVSFEWMGRPGCYLSCKGCSDEHGREKGGAEARMVCEYDPGGASPAASAEATWVMEVVYEPGGGQSELLRPAARPDLALAADPGGNGTLAAAMLADGCFAVTGGGGGGCGGALWTEVPPPATYPPVSFWARPGNGRSYLLYPLSDMVDERYTVYWDVLVPP